MLHEKVSENQVIKKEITKSNEQLKGLENQVKTIEDQLKSIEKSKNSEIAILKQQIAKMEQHNQQQKVGNDQAKGGLSAKEKSSKLLEKSKSKFYFENNILQIEVISLKNYGPYFNLALKHINKTQEPIIIRAFEHRMNTFLIDNYSNQFNYIPPYDVGRGNELTLSDRGRNIELIPGIPRVISFQFSCHIKSYGKVFTFSSKYGYAFNKGFVPLPHNIMYVSIQGINLE